MSSLHCTLTAQPSKLQSFLWRLFQLFTLSLECQCCLSADNTPAFFLVFFFFYFLWRSQSVWNGQVAESQWSSELEKDRKMENESNTLGSQTKVLKHRKPQVRHLTKGKNYNLMRLSNKNKLHCEWKELCNYSNGIEIKMCAVFFFQKQIS